MAPRASQPGRSARGPLGRVRPGRGSLLHVDGQPAASLAGSRRGTRTDRGPPETPESLPAADPQVARADGASPRAGRRPRAGRDSRSLLGRQTRTTIPQRPSGPRRVGCPRCPAREAADDVARRDRSRAAVDGGHLVRVAGLQHGRATNRQRLDRAGVSNESVRGGQSGGVDRAGTRSAFSSGVLSGHVNTPARSDGQGRGAGRRMDRA